MFNPPAAVIGRRKVFLGKLKRVVVVTVNEVSFLQLKDSGYEDVLSKCLLWGGVPGPGSRSN